MCVCVCCSEHAVCHSENPVSNSEHPVYISEHVVVNTLCVIVNLLRPFRYRIRCNCVLPGFISTPMTDKVPERVIHKVRGEGSTR